MIQAYEQNGEYRPYEGYENSSGTQNGITFSFEKTDDAVNVSMNGTCTTGEGVRAVFYPIIIDDVKNLAVKFQTSIGSNDENIYFSAMYTINGEMTEEIFLDGSKVYELSIPEGATQARFRINVSSGAVVDTEFTLKTYTKKTENLCPEIPNNEYYLLGGSYQGISQDGGIERGNPYMTVSGQSTQPEGEYTILNMTYDLDDYGNVFTVTTNQDSDSESVIFGMRGTLNDAEIFDYFQDGTNEKIFTFPPGTTGIKFALFIPGGVTVNKKVGFYIKTVSYNENFFDTNGDMTLTPTAATVHAILNGEWEAEIQHPIDDIGRWKYLAEGNVIKMPSFNDDQFFRVKKSKKMDSGVTATMEPVFMDALDDCYLVDVRPTNQTGQNALNIMTASNPKYSGQSNITKQSTAYYQNKNLIEAINGDDDNSFINRWGGEILYNNYTVIINDRVGGDYGVELRYGKNIPADGLTEEVDINDMVTRIYPKAYNGYTMSGLGYVDSPIIGDYPTIKTATITFDDVKMAEDASEDDEENGVIVCATQEQLNNALIEKCNEQYEAGIDKPTVNIEADMILLQNTEQYKDYQVLEEVSLGDTIHCIHNKLGIVTDARVIELEYDSIRKKVTSVVLGDFKYNYFSDVSSAVNRIDGVIRPNGTVIAEQIAGFIDGAMASLRAQYNIADKQDVMAILFENLDTTSPMYGAVGIGTQGIQISKTRTSDGKAWDWTTALTAEGIIANIIVAGILSDSVGKNFWNLETGELNLEGTFNMTGGNISVDTDSDGTNVITLNGPNATIQIYPASLVIQRSQSDNGARISLASGGSSPTITVSTPGNTPPSQMSDSLVLAKTIRAYETLMIGGSTIYIDDQGYLRRQ